MRFPFYILLSLLAFPSMAQEVIFPENTFKIAVPLIAKNQYLKAADTALAIKNKYDQQHHIRPDSIIDPSFPDQANAFFQSLLGEEFFLKWKSHKVNQQDQALSFKPAVNYIIEQAKGKQVVMINEDHNTPKHRILTHNLLNELYKMGFRYLCMEDLADDTVLHRGYPKFNAGMYMVEPNMANLVKKALKLGFKVVPYESEDDTPYEEKSPAYTDNLREIHEAKNIYRILLKDPKAKILVHAGHGHIFEHGGDIIFMAEYFKIISGINPLTINQSINSLNEFSSRLDASADLTRSDIPYVVLNKDQTPRVSIRDRQGDYDLLVAWPTPKIVSGRKDYLLAKNDTRKYLIKTNPKDEGYLLQVRSLNPDNEIPIDQFIVKKDINQYATAVPKGNYLIQLVNREAKVLWKKQIRVD